MKLPHTSRLLLATALALGTLLAGATTVEAAPSSTSVAHLWVEPAAGYGFLDAAVESAQHSVDLSMYELRDPAMEAALAQRARAGVVVNVLLNVDYFGRHENTPAFNYLRAHGVHVAWAPSGQIFHAKYLVIDAHRAYVGSGNFVASDYPDTRDYWVLETTPAEVAAMTTTFLSDFHGVSTTVTSPGLVWSPGSLPALAALIASAHHSLLIENEEMYSYPVEDDLVAAAQRGVTVEVVMTSDSEYTSDLQYLVRHGVRVRLLGSSGLYIHAKAICADCAGAGGTVFLGSVNFSTSSLNYNRELGVVTTTHGVVVTVARTIIADGLLGTPLAG